MENKKAVPVLIAIDGNCAAGKTTLAAKFQKELGGNVFHMDDYYLQAYQRTENRLKETGGNVDYERFKSEVIKPVERGEKVEVYTCIHPDFTLKYKETIKPERLNIIEGSYSCHPYFGAAYDIRIFVEISYDLQLGRIYKRNGEAMFERFKNEWIPKENEYFEKMQIKEGCLQIMP